MFDQQAHQREPFGVADAIGNLKDQIGLAAAPVGEQEVAFDQARPRAIEAGRMQRDGRLEKLAEIVRLLENRADAPIHERPDWVFVHRESLEFRVSFEAAEILVARLGKDRASRAPLVIFS